jgi:signal transduction histidine kinase/DNA-binding NarL/FixJ family response regulator
MSHELRTPLNAILGYAQIFKRRQLDPDITNGLNIVQQSGEHLLTLVNDILDLSKIEAGKMELSPTQVHLPVFLDDIASIIRVRVEAKDLGFTFQAMGDLPIWVKADETRLRQILLNLLDNAIKFTEAGQVTLRVAGRQQQSEQGSQGAEEQGGDFSPAPRPPGLPADPARLPSTLYRLRFEVEDTGIGIPPDQLERIFQPFEQAGDVARWTKGMGLGLAISRQLVRLMGSYLHVKSPSSSSLQRGEDLVSPPLATEGESPTSILPSVAACGDRRKEVKGGPGSAFWFEVELPIIEGLVEAAPLPERVITGYKGPRRVVLVVDDVSSNRAVVVDLLTPLGFEVIEAADGQQAIHLAQELRPDLILMDRWMPVLDGFEAARQIRQMPEMPEMVIIAISASVSEEDQAQSRGAGYDAFLPKPVNWPRLAALLEEHLGLEWTYGQEEGSKGAGESAPPPLRSSAPLVPPPQEEMAILHELALRGYMQGIRKRAAHIETLGQQYVPFVYKLRELVKGFEERQILALIERYMEENQ